ncbi:MAG: hypothetical protein M0R06_03360 [Sphaerochaeta sp.]|jgi:hypothetical protein|nr:hypothetical protein [Dehalococcoidia bacterium]MCK9598052.1 hypothetical protein [Sphaerochaeta sp.]
MAANTFNIVDLPLEGNLFYVSYESSDLTGAADLVAASTGKSHYITHIHVRTATAMNIEFGSGTSGGAVSTRHIGLVAVNAASGFFMWKSPLGKAMKLTAGATLGVDVSASGQIWIEVWGKTA